MKARLYPPPVPNVIGSEELDSFYLSPTAIFTIIIQVALFGYFILDFFHFLWIFFAFACSWRPDDVWGCGCLDMKPASWYSTVE